MFKLTAKLIGKSLVKEGESSHGKYQVVKFMVMKQHKKVKRKIVFVAFNKVAQMILDFALEQRITIYFEPECKEYKGKWYTELKATNVELYVRKNRLNQPVVPNTETLIEDKYAIKDDRPLFSTEEGR